MSQNYFRPDRVMRTGVVQSAAGFSPPQAVMENAARFTGYPYNQTYDTNSLATALRGPSAQFLGGRWWQPEGPGLIDRLKIYFATRKAMRAAQKAGAGVAGFGSPSLQLMGLTPNGPASAMGPMINAMPSGRRDMLAMIAAKQMPNAWSNNALETISRRWNGRG